MKAKITHVLLFLLIPTLLIAQTEWFVSPTGSPPPIGDGSEANPWDLQTALNSSSVQAGHTILLAGGQYNGRFTSTISGTAGAGNEITVRSKDGEWAVLNGNVSSSKASVLTVTGGYVHFKDFEITHKGSFTRKKGNTNFSSCNGIYHTAGFDCKFINLVIHDNPGSGIGSWKYTAGTEIYGCVIYNNGWVEPTGRYLHGAGLYVQNSSDQIRLLKNNIIFNQFYKDIEIWSACSSDDDSDEGGCGDYVKNVDVIENTVFNSGDVAVGDTHKDNIIVATGDVSGVAIARNINIEYNVLYHNTDFTKNGTLDDSPTLTLGYVAQAPIENVVVKNNIIMGRNNALRFFSASTLTYEKNLSWGRFAVIREENITNSLTDTWTFNNNTYFTRYNSEDNTKGTFRRDGSSNMDRSFASWQTDTGLDISSSWGSSEKASYFQPNNFVKITPNFYDSNRFKVVTLNIGGTAINADFSNFSDFPDVYIGLKYVVRDVENYNTIIGTGTVDASKQINIPTNLTTFSGPLGTDFVDGSEKTSNNFGVFLIEFESKCYEETTWAAGVWDNGLPSDTKEAIIDAAYIVGDETTGEQPEFEACSLTVTKNGSVVIKPEKTITVHNNLINNSTPENFVVMDDASIVMIEDDGIVSGKITVEKKWAEHLFNPANSPDVNSDKYSIWATPMIKEDSKINNTFSNNAVTYYWNTVNSPNSYDQLWGSNYLVPGRGYYLRQNDGSDFDINVPRQFVGVINNGEIEENNIRFEPDNPIEAPFENSHFFGNPYPSAIDLEKFYNDNSDEIEGTVYFWKQENNTTATYGGLITPEWVTLNGLGSVPEGKATPFISTAQGFAVLAIQNFDLDRSVIFKNSQRVINNNTQFFKTSKTNKVASKNTNNTNSNKIWLQMLNEVAVSPMLLGFLPETSNAYNSYYDGKLVEETSLIEFYSVLDDDKFVIQGRDQLMFTSQSVPLGYKVTQAGNYTIEIDTEYISQNFSIILEDTLESTFTDLRAESYEFSVAAPIEDNTRFVLHFNYADPTVIASFDYEKQCDSYGFDLDFNFTGGTENATFLWDFGVNASPTNLKLNVPLWFLSQKKY